jgi:mediator of RNA polymerase II transcription subunit 18
MLQATVRVANGTDVDSVNIGVNELKAFAASMKGAVDLDIGDRLAMDTRVK